jgi:hypothetical protein
MKTLRLRRAVSLVELLATMSACTVILTLSAGLMHRAMHAQTKARAFCDGERSALRLANSFRNDVHQATGAARGDAAAGQDVALCLALGGDQFIEYRHTADKVTRVLLEGGQVRGRDEFAFPSAIELTVQQESTRFVVLSITSAPEVSSAEEPATRSIAYATPVNCNVEAGLGRDHWFTAPKSGQEESR